MYGDNNNISNVSSELGKSPKLTVRFGVGRGGSQDKPVLGIRDLAASGSRRHTLRPRAQKPGSVSKNKSEIIKRVGHDLGDASV